MMPPVRDVDSGRMTRDTGAHTWGPIYEHSGTSYRECTEPDCHGHQEWICALDRWSDAFDTLPPRASRELTEADKQEPPRSG